MLIPAAAAELSLIIAIFRFYGAPENHNRYGVSYPIHSDSRIELA